MYLCNIWFHNTQISRFINWYYSIFILVYSHKWFKLILLYAFNLFFLTNWAQFKRIRAEPLGIPIKIYAYFWFFHKIVWTFGICMIYCMQRLVSDTLRWAVVWVRCKHWRKNWLREEFRNRYCRCARADCCMACILWQWLAMVSCDTCHHSDCFSLRPAQNSNET